MAPIVVALGGTGVIGSHLAAAAAQRGLECVSFSLDAARVSPGYRNVRIDFRELSAGELFSALSKILPAEARIYALVDIAGLTPGQLSELADFAAQRCAAVGSISSCLLYDHDHSGAVDETCPLVQDNPAIFPYQKRKLAQENALASRGNVAWRVFRTHHVIGRGALLGCIPNHNRDAELFRRLRRVGPLHLANSGDVRLSFVHAADLANAVLDLVGDPSTVRQAMNIVHPDPIVAKTYFRILAGLIGAPEPLIEPHRPDPDEFWSLTARDNVFVSRHPSVGALRFRHDLRSALAEAICVDESEYRASGAHMARRISGT